MHHPHGTPHLDARTELCALIGNPVHHSLSPAIHNAAFAAAGLNLAYLAFRVEDVGNALRGARALGLRGLSVTIPHKVAVIEHLDELDPIAARIGSVNTIVNRAGRLIGYTTDGVGALAALREASADPRDRDVVILGAGGSARAIAMTLALESPPRRLAIAARDARKAERLAGDVASAARGVAASGLALDHPDVAARVRGAQILIHTTSVGMAPHTTGCVVPSEWLAPTHTVFDIVYTPRETELLRRATRAGARPVLGLEMFVRQAAAQFELWTGLGAPLDVLRRAAEAGLAA
ncbi:MAG: shikimate dehydrogenase [bacterium]